MPNKYERGKIYKIIANGSDECYIGSTTEKTLAKRMVGHRCVYKRWKTGKKVGKTSSINLFEKYGIENCKIVLIELYPTESNDQLRAREEYWRKEYIGGSVNKLAAYRTEEEAKDIATKWRKTDYAKNKDKYIAFQKKYRKENKQKLYDYEQRPERRKKKNERAAIYRENNREELRKRNKIQDQKRAAKRKIERAVKIECECGSLISKGNLSTHKKSKKHINFINNNN